MKNTKILIFTKKTSIIFCLALYIYDVSPVSKSWDDAYFKIFY